MAGVGSTMVLQSVLETVSEGCMRSNEPVEAFAITSMGETTIVVDGTGAPLHSAMVTGDSRGIAEAKRLVEMVPRKRIMDITGVPASEMYSLPKWIWLNEQTDVFLRGAYVFLFEDYIAWTLTGERKVSYSSAARTMAFDVGKKQWDEGLLSIAGLNLAKMSQPVPPGEIVGTVTPDAAKRYDLPENLLVVAGGHDQNMAALGAGVNHPDIAEDGIGTCEVLSAMLDGPLKTDYMMENELVCIPYAYPNTYLTYIVLPTVGILMNWTRDSFFSHLDWDCKQNGKKTLAVMDGKVGDTPSGLLVLPQFGSAGIPDVDYDAKGLIWGLTVHTEPIQIYRAVLEGLSYHMYMAYQRLKSLSIKNEELRLTGGGSNSEPILQMRADVFYFASAQMENPSAHCGLHIC